MWEGQGLRALPGSRRDACGIVAGARDCGHVTLTDDPRDAFPAQEVIKTNLYSLFPLKKYIA